MINAFIYRFNDYLYVTINKSSKYLFSLHKEYGLILYLILMTEILTADS